MHATNPLRIARLQLESRTHQHPISDRRAFSTNPRLDLVDLKGKVIIVTGGNSGIGYETIKILSKHGAKVYMAARNESRAAAAITRLETEGVESGKVSWLRQDLADPRLAKKAADEFKKKERRLDVLINNAAIVSAPFALTSDGLSDMMVTNYLSPYIFTKSLLPLLKETALLPDSDVRIVNVTSRAHSFIKAEGSERPRFDTVEAFNKRFDGMMAGPKRYAWSKLAQILHTWRLQNELRTASIPITCISVHPGDIKTASTMKGAESQHWYIRIFTRLIVALFCQPAELGGITPAFAAASKEVAENKEKFGGAYLIPYGKISSGSEYAQDDMLADELWATTEKILKDLKL
ncbi:NAD-P-binding protein [Sistotremastrum niveocremeum HHB9708]|uniref:NAD-P-binding protein n=1 Tax=Sistotremastrum niveocremeum HHB9708 TaxID=1314777 RepID=A0A164NE27_9AGAM|nr:NAD-P-binding protein [Sistotremastrum niveocremeum HHB9708]